MLSGVGGAIQRWQYRGGRPQWSARITNRLCAILFAAGIGPNRAATLEVRGHKSGRMISFPVVVADYQGERVNANSPWWSVQRPILEDPCKPGIGGGSDDGRSSVPDVWHRASGERPVLQWVWLTNQ
jgi:hypothetical protein